MIEKHTELRRELHRELHRLAHDLRNVLSLIYSHAQILEISLAKPGTGEEQKIAQAIGESVRKMDAMLTERVDVLEKGKD